MRQDALEKAVGEFLFRLALLGGAARHDLSFAGIDRHVGGRVVNLAEQFAERRCNCV
jgi:hypothetical protein